MKTGKCEVCSQEIVETWGFLYDPYNLPPKDKVEEYEHGLWSIPEAKRGRMEFHNYCSIRCAEVGEEKRKRNWK